MGFKCGIVGLPNVGKSTLFNALTETQAAQAANYPFCTIEPNVGQVAVPDPRLDKLAAIANSAKIIPTQLAFVDIAGLVKGVGGEGLATSSSATFVRSMLSCVCAVSKCRHPACLQQGRSIADAEVVERSCCCPTSKARKARPTRSARPGATRNRDCRLRAQPGRSTCCGRQVARLTGQRTMRRRGLPGAAADRLPVLYVCNVNEDEAASGNEQSAGCSTNPCRRRGGGSGIGRSKPTRLDGHGRTDGLPRGRPA
jgi:hypothetical protein